MIDVLIVIIIDHARIYQYIDHVYQKNFFS